MLAGPGPQWTMEIPRQSSAQCVLLCLGSQDLAANCNKHTFWHAQEKNSLCSSDGIWEDVLVFIKGFVKCQQESFYVKINKVISILMVLICGSENKNLGYHTKNSANLHKMITNMWEIKRIFIKLSSNAGYLYNVMTGSFLERINYNQHFLKGFPFVKIYFRLLLMV